MNIFISVVSHGHGDLIRELDVLSKLNQSFNVIIKNNIADETLESYARDNKIEFINSEYNLGFGENNNKIYSHVINNYIFSELDLFIVINPDVYVDVETIIELSERMNESRSNIAGINLYIDREYIEYDNSIRKFPGFLDFTSSILGFGNSTIIDKSSVLEPTYVDWVAGSFIAFTMGNYNKLGGFDEHYFMYCEDIDICYRSKNLGSPVIFFPDIRAVHLAKHANRTLFSKHFKWHIESAVRFLLKKYFMIGI
ncbi:glycosyltransferase family 2 protein [Aliivibrio fischeri]|uniref:glycosyltransferase family 2 protein n=1 Tax=Aliivibrio fischeri TaxID=668 RepID=UPI0012D8CD16|nr:glycosyltransferase family 2 protein [Aliivibrio fischeri]MUK92259.1 glycosyltransferase family 2 protein [Aliivibrio fischeri]